MLTALGAVTRSPKVSVCLTSVRWASSSSKNKRQRSGRPLHYGVKVMEGQLIPAGTMLTKQRLLQAHPGENVFIGKSGNLHAAVNGTVMITWEHFLPTSDHYWIERAYAYYDKAKPIYMRYFHVIPVKSTPEFCMVGEV